MIATQEKNLHGRHVSVIETKKNVISYSLFMANITFLPSALARYTS
ncbi:hypothetical protein IC620_06120 [Hazenella sp. IB182357]|uniref:Uncharacterized protein n=1 Tax=Polycladospora coralii TaxID=2771432 RepID=A0A926NAB5_9BACL|nr:hypothetical protein [Polycladospora coralii]MBD1371935.1 hypothetical protein [Polycladospora coralii]